MALIQALDAPLTGERPRANFASERLAGSRCRACGAASWPARGVCHRCGSADLVATEFAQTGTLETYTKVWIPRPGIEPPYTVGQIQVDDAGPRLFAHVRNLPDEAAVPHPVRLELTDASVVPWFWFVADEGDD